MTKEGKGLREHSGAKPLYFNIKKLECPVCRVLYILYLFQTAHLYTVFILSVEERLHITNEVVDKYVPP